MNDYLRKAHAIITNNIYATVATVDTDSNPWAAPQFFYYDQDSHTIYWCTSKTSQHAQNLMSNHKAYITIYDSSVGPGAGEGVYMRADGDIVTDTDEAATAISHLIARHQDVPYWTTEDIQEPDSPIKIFKARIIRMWVDEGKEDRGHFALYREVVTLPDQIQG